MQQVHDMIEMLGDKLTSMVNSDGVVGSPLKLGEVTLVPVSRLSVGLGAGGGSGEGQSPQSKQGKGKGSASGSGAGGKVRPVAVLAFTKDGVEILPVPEKQGRLDKLLDKLPGLVERFQKSSQGDKCCG